MSEPGQSRRGLVVVLAVVGVVALVGSGLALTGDDDDSGPAEQPPEIETPELPGAEDSPAELPGAEQGSADPLPAAELGEATPPPTGVPELDAFAQGCFGGDMGDCDLLYLEAVFIQFENEAALDYTIYSQSCGGRLHTTTSVDPCTQLIPTP